MGQSLTFVISPEGNTEVSLDLFQKTIEDIRRLVIDLDYAVTKDRGKRRWVIESLSSSNPTVTLRPLLPNEPLMEIIVTGVASVSKGVEAPPHYFSEPSLEDLRGMRRLFRGKDRAKLITISHNGHPAEIGRDIGEKVDRIFRGGYAAFGAIEGTLEAVSFHGSPTFTIWDRVSKAPVRCHFPRNLDWKSRVKELLEKRVMVRGKIQYFVNGVPHSITDIREILNEEPNGELPKAKFGALGDNRPQDMNKFLQQVREGV